MSEQEHNIEEQQGQPPTGTAPETAGNDNGGERTFTQEELDAIVQQRLNRERSKYGDYDDLKAKASKWAEYEEAQKSELEKLQEKVNRLEGEKQKSEVAYRDRLMRAEVRLQAAQMGFRNPDDAYHLAALDSLTIDDDGKIVGAKEALEALAQDRPYLLAGDPGKPPAPRPDAGAGNPPSNEGVPDSVRMGIDVAKQYGYKLDPKQVAERAKRLGKK